MNNIDKLRDKLGRRCTQAEWEQLQRDLNKLEREMEKLRTENMRYFWKYGPLDDDGVVKEPVHDNAYDDTSKVVVG